MTLMAAKFNLLYVIYLLQYVLSVKTILNAEFAGSGNYMLVTVNLFSSTTVKDKNSSENIITVVLPL